MIIPELHISKQECQNAKLIVNNLLCQTGGTFCSENLRGDESFHIIGFCLGITLPLGPVIGLGIPTGWPMVEGAGIPSCPRGIVPAIGSVGCLFAPPARLCGLIRPDLALTIPLVLPKPSPRPAAEDLIIVSNTAAEWLPLAARPAIF